MIEGVKPSAYGVLVLSAVGFSLWYWLRAAKSDQRFLTVYAGALGGAFVGAKLAFLLAEGWQFSGSDFWQQMLFGKSVTGALLGGFLGVELGKKLVGFTQSTGDRFAMVLPWGMVMGRLGCLQHGCCTGKLLASGAHWPAVEVELAVNLLLGAAMLLLRRKPWAQNQLFHLYLMAYGTFRFFHEWMRDTPKFAWGISGYQLIALAIALVGAWAFMKRRKAAGDMRP